MDPNVLIIRAMSLMHPPIGAVARFVNGSTAVAV